MKENRWVSLVVPSDGLSNSANWMVVASAVEDRIVRELTGIEELGDHLELYAATEGMPAADGVDEAVHQQEIVNEARTLFNYNESLPAYCRAMEILKTCEGKDYQIAETNDRTVVVLIEAAK